MTWAARRQFFITLILFGIILLIAFSYAWPVLTKAPSCTDGKQDGTETGVDCGGSCPNLCADEVKMPIVLWSRAFPVTSSVYNAVAYIENDNAAAIQSLPYEFRFYDASGIFITRVDGTALVPPLGTYAIVETGIKAGNSQVAQTTFAFGTTTSPWLHVPADIAGLNISVTNITMSNVDTIPKLTATLTNPSVTTTLNNTSVAAIMYDGSDNAINASKTFVPKLAPGASVPIFFTWPQPITTPIVRYDIIPIIDIFHTTK